jgi:outer membrane protein
MNKIVILTLLLLGISMTGSYAQDKIAHINSASLMKDLPEIKAADSKLQAFQTQLQKKGEQMVTDLQAKYQDLSKKQQNGEISPKDLDTQSAALKAEESKINDYQQDMNNQLVQKRQELFQPILDRLNNLINDVAKEKGYNYVFDTSTGVLLYADEKYDLTEAVRAKINAAAQATPADKTGTPTVKANDKK